MMKEMSAPENSEGLEVRALFVRKRNALVTRAEFSELYVDYYLHLARHQLLHEAECDMMLKDALAAAVLYSASKPRNETTAWTIHFEDPLLNLFVSGNNPSGTVVGNLFRDDVKCAGNNLFYSDLIQGKRAPRRSVTDFEGRDVFRAVEVFCRQSEQRLVRCFRFAEEDFVMVSAQPDCDIEWLESLDDEKIRELDRQETLSLLEKRWYRWECGCSQDRLMEVLAPTMRANPESLFEGGELIRAGCPRCGARHKISREAMEAWVAEHQSGKK